MLLAPHQAWIWANQPIHSFFVGCLNACCQGASVRVGLGFRASWNHRSKLLLLLLPTPHQAWIWANQPIHSFFIACLNPCLQGTSVRVGLGFRVSWNHMSKLLLLLLLAPHQAWIWVNQPVHSIFIGCLNPCLQGTCVRVGLGFRASWNHKSKLLLLLLLAPHQAWIWANQPIPSFFVGCLNPCLQGTSVWVGLGFRASWNHRSKLLLVLLLAPHQAWIWVTQPIHLFFVGRLNPCLQGASVRVGLGFRASWNHKSKLLLLLLLAPHQAWIWANQPIHLFFVGCINPCLQGTSVRVALP